MRYSVAVAALVATASASYNYTTPAAPVYPVYTTEVVTGYETYCPSATEITHGGKTYTVTEATTLTITDCPCTITKPVETPVYTPSVPVETPIYTSGAPVETPVYSSPAPYYPSTNGTSAAPVVPTVYPTGTSAPTTTAPPAFTGAASKASVGLAAVLGFAAYIL